MIEEQLAQVIREAVAAAAPELGLEDVPEAIEVVRPRQKEHGDYTTNIALALAPRIVRNPRDVAAIVVKHLPQAGFVAKAEVAGPGFINVFLAHGWLYEELGEVERLGPAYGQIELGAGERVQVEFVSTNP